MSGYDPTDIQAQARVKHDDEVRDKLDRETEVADLKWLMGSKRGRRIVWRDLEASGVYRLSFNTNAMTMAFTEGNRNAGLTKLAMIHEICPEHYLTMVKEANERRNPDGPGHTDP